MNKFHFIRGVEKNSTKSSLVGIFLQELQVEHLEPVQHADYHILLGQDGGPEKANVTNCNYYNTVTIHKTQLR